MMGGPRTNLQVVAILERANAIRQVYKPSLATLLISLTVSADHSFVIYGHMIIFSPVNQTGCC